MFTANVEKKMLRWYFPESLGPALGCAPELGVGRRNGDGIICMYVCMLNSSLIAFDTGERLLFLSVFLGFWWFFFTKSITLDVI